MWGLGRPGGGPHEAAEALLDRDPTEANLFPALAFHKRKTTARICIVPIPWPCFLSFTGPGERLRTKEMKMNWNDPAARADLIARVGVSEYDRLQKEEHKRQTIETVNGHAIRIVYCRFGKIYMVDGTNCAHQTLEGARKIARNAKSP
jgi:hypothetical protein